MAVGFVQAGYALNLSGEASLAYTSPNTAGNLLVAYVRLFGAGGVPAPPMDTQGNNWTLISNTVSGAANIFSLYYAANCKGGTNTVTTQGTATGNELIIYEASGVAVSSPLDLNTTATGTGATGSVGPLNVTANELIVAAFGNVTAGLTGTLTAGGSGATFTNRANATTAGTLVLEDAAAPALGNVTATEGFGIGSVSWIAAMATFAPAVVFSISGNAGVASANVAYSGTASGNVTADGSGNYTISGLANGPYTITPSLTGYAFSPTSANETVSGGNITGVNFTATQQTVATPTFSPVAGTYSSTQSVAISTTTPGASIFYTTDGSTPTTGSTPYSGPVSVSVSLTLKAIATASGFINSAVGSSAYVISSTPGTHYSVPDARNYGNFPNLSTNVNGTLTYTVPKVYSLKYWFDVLFNRTQPLPEDCRAAGAPVASGTYPQNSRAPGVYGPGE